MRDFEARLWRAENRVERIELPTLAQRVAAIEPTIWQLWGRQPPVAVSSSSVVVLNLTVTGYNGMPLPGALCYLTATNGANTASDTQVTDAAGQCTLTLTFFDSSPIAFGTLLVSKTPEINAGAGWDAITDLALTPGATSSFTADVTPNTTPNYLGTTRGPEPVYKTSAYVDDSAFGTVGLGWSSATKWNSGGIRPIYEVDFAAGTVTVTYTPGGGGTATSTASFVSWTSYPYSSVPNWAAVFSAPAGGFWPSGATLTVRDQ